MSEPIKAILTFDLPEAETELRFALDGLKWWCVVWDIDQELRSLYKYGELSNKEADRIEKLRDFIREKCSNNGLTLDQ